MSRPVSGVRTDAGAVLEARDSTPSRGLSSMPHATTVSHERIRTVVVDDHEGIARLVANRIAPTWRTGSSVPCPLLRLR